MLAEFSFAVYFLSLKLINFLFQNNFRFTDKMEAQR